MYDYCDFLNWNKSPKNKGRDYIAEFININAVGLELEGYWDSEPNYFVHDSSVELDHYSDDGECNYDTQDDGQSAEICAHRNTLKEDSFL